MSNFSLLNRATVAVVLVALSATAFAGGGGGSRGPGPYPYVATGTTTATLTRSSTADGAPSVQGKTRADVRGELLRAEEAGLVPVPKKDYPISATAIERNRIRFQQIQHAWGTGRTTTAQ